MEWAQFSILIATLAGLFLWSRSEARIDRDEARSDWRHMDTKVDAIHAEIKDFHGRMCALEERYLNWVMRDK